VVPFNGYCRQILDIAHHRVVSYQSSCSDHSWHRRHDVHRQRCLQPGHCPRVAKVFHTVPQLLNGGSGPSTESQHHRLECAGCQPHRGHLIELATPSSSSDVVVTRSSGDGSRFNSWSDIRSNRAIGSSCREYRKTRRPHPGRNSTRCQLQTSGSHQFDLHSGRCIYCGRRKPSETRRLRTRQTAPGESADVQLRNRSR